MASDRALLAARECCTHLARGPATRLPVQNHSYLEKGRSHQALQKRGEGEGPCTVGTERWLEGAELEIQFQGETSRRAS